MAVGWSVEGLLAARNPRNAALEGSWPLLVVPLLAVPRSVALPAPPPPAAGTPGAPLLLLPASVPRGRPPVCGLLGTGSGVALPFEDAIVAALALAARPVALWSWALFCSTKADNAFMMLNGWPMPRPGVDAEPLLPVAGTRPPAEAS